MRHASPGPLPHASHPGLDGMAQLLNERFHVLTIGRRGALARHRTLHGDYPPKASLGWMLANLFGILVERGGPQDLDEALIYGRQAMPYVYEAECTWITIDHFSLRMAKLGQWEYAARILGWSDAYYCKRSHRRQGNEERALQSCRTGVAGWVCFAVKRVQTRIGE